MTLDGRTVVVIGATGGRPHEISASYVANLDLMENGFITGQVLSVDAGVMLAM